MLSSRLTVVAVLASTAAKPAPPDPLGDAPINVLPPLRRLPLGELGPPGSRERLPYYDHLYLMSAYFGATARTMLEIGCSDPPFARHLGWIEKRVCVAPYFATYDVRGSTKNLGRADVRSVRADFLTWEPPAGEVPYDLVVCSQVLEHLDEPSRFLQKMIAVGRVVIVSVPFQWDDSNEYALNTMHHKQHFITADKFRHWALPHVPVLELITRAAMDDNNRNPAKDMAGSRVIFAFKEEFTESHPSLEREFVRTTVDEQGRNLSVYRIRKYRVRKKKSRESPMSTSQRLSKLGLIRQAELDGRPPQRAAAAQSRKSALEQAPGGARWWRSPSTSAGGQRTAARASGETPCSRVGTTD